MLRHRLFGGEFGKITRNVCSLDARVTRKMDHRNEMKV